MQVPLIDRINDLQVVGLNSLQNPSSSFPSQITTSLASFSVAYSFCKWGAVILALVATFGSIINRVVTVFIIRFRAKARSLPSLNDDEFYTSSDDEDYQNDDDDLTYSSSESEDDDEPSTSSSFIRLDEYFRVRGADNNNIDDELQTQNDTQKRCRSRSRSIGDILSLSELANSKSVVKLWDSIGFGLGLDFDDYEDGVVSDYDDVGSAAASSTACPAVVVSAGEGACGNLALEIWDTRLRRRKPMVVAEWGPTVGKTLRVESGGVQKVYVRDDGRYGLTVGDMRKVSTPLGNVTESDADTTWWDADANVVSDEPFGEQQSMLPTCKLQQPT